MTTHEQAPIQDAEQTARQVDDSNDIDIARYARDTHVSLEDIENHVGQYGQHSDDKLAEMSPRDSSIPNARTRVGNFIGSAMKGLVKSLFSVEDKSPPVRHTFTEYSEPKPDLKS